MIETNAKAAPAAAIRELEIVTATWGRDLGQFGLLRHALKLSGLRDLPHRVGVHSEDHPLFEQFATRPVELLSTRQILSADLDTQRQQTLRRQKRLGRTLTKWLSSTARWGWPSWPRYLGWQMQQITKLSMLEQSRARYVLVMDSDLIVSRHASVADFLPADRLVCLHQPTKATDLRGKVAKWTSSAEQLLNLSTEHQGMATTYFDTPFPMSPDVVRAMLRWLEDRYQQPWWQVMLNQPPRRWSEFAVYRGFLAAHYAGPVEWREPSLVRYLYHSDSTAKLAEQVVAQLSDPGCGYLTVHSQSSGRSRGDIAAALPRLHDIVDAHYAQAALQ